MFKYRVWCPDCFGDKYGCFDGGSETSEEEYHTIEEADEAGYDCARKSIWSYKVIEVETGDVVKVND